MGVARKHLRRAERIFWALKRGVYLGEPPLRELWAEIAARELIVFIHPDGVRDPWFQNFSLWNSARTRLPITTTSYNNMTLAGDGPCQSRAAHIALAPCFSFI